MTGPEKACAFILFGTGVCALVFAAQILMQMFRRKTLQELRLCHEEFNVWKEQKKMMTWYSDEDFLELYIKETGYSPFMDDHYCQEAKKFLIEQGWDPSHIHEV